MCHPEAGQGVQGTVHSWEMFCVVLTFGRMPIYWHIQRNWDGVEIEKCDAKCKKTNQINNNHIERWEEQNSNLYHETLTLLLTEGRNSHANAS